MTGKQWIQSWLWRRIKFLNFSLHVLVVFLRFWGVVGFLISGLLKYVIISLFGAVDIRNNIDIISGLSLPSLSPRITRARAVTVADLVQSQRVRSPPKASKAVLPRGDKRKRAGTAQVVDPPGPDIQLLDPQQQSVERKMDLNCTWGSHRDEQQCAYYR